jgi:glyoxylate/hydroxypyruvate reductase
MWMCGHSLENSTVGIVGLGRIGFAVARGCKPFGPKRFIYSDQVKNSHDEEIPAEHVSFDYLIQEADFVIAMCPLNKQTRGMFNKSVFQKMKKTAIFINTSRGGVVNHNDLYECLSQNEIFGAGIDVTEPEPLPPTHPLLTLANCVVTPHVGSATMEVRNNMSELTARNILAALNNEPMPEPVVF